MTIAELNDACTAAEQDGQVFATVAVAVQKPLYKNTLTIAPGLSGRVTFKGKGPGIPATVHINRLELRAWLNQCAGTGQSTIST